MYADFRDSITKQFDLDDLYPKSLGFCKGCSEEGDFAGNLCDKCFNETKEANRIFEAEKQRWNWWER